MKLSCEQLVEGNIKLVYYLYNKLNKSEFVYIYKDDLISEGMVGLVKAAKSFDCDRDIRFATYASRCINNQMFMFMRKFNKIKKEISLYAPITTDENGNELYLSDVLESNEIPQETLIGVLDFESYLNGKKERDKIMFLAYCRGYKQSEIGRHFGLSQSYISRIINSIKKGCNYSN